MSIAVRIQATSEGVGIQLPELDYYLISAACALLGFGLVMVASASLHRIGAAPFYFVLRHLIAMGIGLVAALALFQVSVKQLQKMGGVLYLFGLLLLLLVLLPGLGKEVNGATRWIPIGPFSLQSSEFMKLFLVVYIAGYLVRRQLEVTHTVWGFIKPMILLVLASTLIMIQPDFGTTTVLLVTALGMLFLGGVPVWQFLILIALAGSALFTLVIFSPYRLQRVTTFLDPWA
ncbi:MAG: FtsW/RodA/SpoVE family cell cycle protein, partial [Gammaproteobacteria bacterium]|nr:FtsW/RodA/SpoVE family cell cycle protein [Gammaproteobacteria bacterium]